MSLRDRLLAWFKGEKTRKAPGKSTAGPSTGAVRELETFLSSRSGVEGYIEPKTAIYSTTLLLVAADGEYIRRPVRDRDQAENVCNKFGAPLYDAAKVGYPKRMRDYDRGIRPDTVALDDLPPWPGDEATNEATGEIPDEIPDEMPGEAEAQDEDENPS